MISGDPFLDEWHRVVAEKDLGGLWDLLAEDVELGPPPYRERFQGREIVHHLLGLILETIDDFTYHREWRDRNELALEFTGRVGDLELQGIDLVTLGDDGTVVSLEVPMRPMNAVESLRDRIAPQMARYFADRARG